jgi:hypothetical protein
VTPFHEGYTEIQVLHSENPREKYLFEQMLHILEYEKAKKIN